MTNELVIYMNEVVNDWTEYEIEKREMLKLAKETLSTNEWREKYSNSENYRLMRMSDEAIRNRNIKEAELLVNKLIDKVSKKVGEIKETSGLEIVSANRGIELNGFIIGENGRCKVQTIIAGGYNIQKCHYRTLVKEVA